MRSEPLCPQNRVRAVVYGLLLVLTIVAYAMIKGLQLTTLVWLLLFARIAYEDIQTKSYPLYLGVAFMVTSLWFPIMSGNLESILVDLVSGLAILTVTGILKNHVGSGDTVVLLGILLAWGHRACGHTLFLAAIFGVMLFSLKIDRTMQKEVTFTPLLFMGMMVYKFME